MISSEKTFATVNRNTVVLKLNPVFKEVPVNDYSQFTFIVAGCYSDAGTFNVGVFAG